MKKILIPTDFSIPADNAFKYAVELAKDIGATISVLYVDSSYFVSSLVGDRTGLLTYKAFDIQTKINELIRDIPKGLFDEQKVVFGAFVASEIVDEAEVGAYDLIVMGMKGEHQRIDKLLGSVTTDLMMKAPCPVLAIPEQATYKRIEKITFATTLPSSSDFPNEEISKFAKALSATVDYVTVENIVRDAKEYDTNEPKSTFFGIEYDIVTNPSIPDGLNDFVVKNNSDVLCLYMKKRQLWERLFHLSTSKEMAYHTKLPLFVFHK